MIGLIRFGILVVAFLPSLVNAAEPLNLSEDTYKSGLGTIIIQVNWGRVWKCGKYENAQLQSLTFSKSPVEEPSGTSLERETPSKLFVDNKFLPYAFVVQPGEYVLTGFNVKIARSKVRTSLSLTSQP